MGQADGATRRTGGTVVIGLSGGVGSGKSAAAAELERLGCARFDADEAARGVLDRPDVRRAIRGWWGDGVLDASGRVDRAAVGAIVFRDPHERRRLEGVVHPIVRAQAVDAVERAGRDGSAAIVLDIPLLLEAGMDAMCDAVLFIDAPRATRLERVRRSRGWDEAEFARRESAQLPAEDKRAVATHVVPNGGDMEGLASRVRGVLADILDAPLGRA